MTKHDFRELRRTVRRMMEAFPPSSGLAPSLDQARSIDYALQKIRETNK